MRYPAMYISLKFNDSAIISVYVWNQDFFITVLADIPVELDSLKVSLGIMIFNYLSVTT